MPSESVRLAAKLLDNKGDVAFTINPMIAAA